MQVKTYRIGAGSGHVAFAAVVLAVVLLILGGVAQAYERDIIQRGILLVTPTFRGEPALSAGGNSPEVAPEGVWVADESGPLADLPVLAAMIQAVREREGESRVLLVHSGRALSAGALGAASRGDIPVRAMSAMGYDLAALSREDFALGEDRIRILQDTAGFPLRSGGAYLHQSGAPFPGSHALVLESREMRIGVVAVGDAMGTDPTSSRPRHGIHFVDRLDAIRTDLAALHMRCDVTVAVTHLRPESARLLLRSVPGIDIIFTGRSGKGLREQVGTATLVAPPEEADLGELVLRLKNGRLDDLDLRWRTASATAAKKKTPPSRNC